MDTPPASPVVDMHIHFGAPIDPESGCFMSEEFRKTPAYLAVLLVTKSLFKRVTIDSIRKHLLATINGSRFVHRSVLLALDMVYSESGVAQPQKTHLYVPNKVIAGLAKSEARVLFGGSVHPYRFDWKEELDACLADGAVLCKWIPSSQMINPSHSNCRPFYQKLASHNLPLLCHAGPEYAIPTSDAAYNEYNNPKYLRPALDEGVTVILAHCAVPYFWFLDVDYKDDFAEFLALFEEAERKRWKLYADVSALCTPLRGPYIDIIKQHVPANRLLFGSDYPIPFSELSYSKSPSFWEWLGFVWRVHRMDNPLDRNYLLIQKMDFPSEMFTNAANVFAAIRY